MRDALIEVGARLFADQGVENVSVEEIIERAGISRRTFYGFFANKYELVGSILDPVLQAGVRQLEALAKGPVEEAIPGIIDFYLRQWESQRDALQIIGLVGHEVLAYIESGHAAFGRAMRRVLEHAEAGGMLRNDRADYTFKVISRTAVPLLKVYRDHPDIAAVYRESMLALLARPQFTEGGPT